MSRGNTSLDTSISDPSDQEGIGDVLQRLMRQGHSFSGRERHCCFLNTGHTRFANVSAPSGLDFPDDGRGVGIVDWDHDGDLDLWMSNRSGPQVRFLRNDMPSDAHHIAFRLVGRSCNRDAIGARVHLQVNGLPSQTQIKTVRAGDAYLSQSSKWVHFGLGSTTKIDRLTVRWPGGDVETFSGVEVDRRYQLIQGTGEAEPVGNPRHQIHLAAKSLDGASSGESARTFLASDLPLPRLEYQTFDGQSASQQKYAGSPVLVNLWGSWCTSCIAELNDLTERATELQASGLAVLALSVDALGDEQGDVDLAQDTLAEMNFPFSAGLASAELIDKLQLVHDQLLDWQRPLPIPSSFLLSPQGRLVAIYKGRLEVETLVADVRRLGRSGEARRRAALPFPGRWLTRQAPHRLLNIATKLRKADLLKDASEYLEENKHFLSSDPRYPEALADLGTALAKQDRHTEALALYRQVLELKPKMAVAHNNIANVLSAKGRIWGAIEHVRQALEQDPDLAEAHHNLACNLEIVGSDDEAQFHFSEAIRLKPNFVEAHFRFANQLERNGDGKTALSHLRRALKIDPNHVDSQHKLSWILATHPDPELRNGDEAVLWSERLCQATQNRAPLALDALAASYAELGRFDEAVATQIRAVKLVQDLQSHLLDPFQARLELYRQQLPFRSP